MFKKLGFTLFLACFHLVLHAQYTDLINSNYPGFSQSPYSVGVGVYQFESNFFNRNIKASPMFENTSTTGVNLHFRTTFLFERLELNVQSSLQKDIITFKNVFESESEKIGLGQLTLGGKYLIYTPEYNDKTKVIRSWKKRHSFDWNRWIPHIGFYAGANIGSALNPSHKKGGTSPKIGLLLQQEFDLKYNFLTNIYYNYIGTDYSEWSYILTATYVFNKHWSGFIEHEAKYNKFENTGSLGGGLAYLFNKDLQVNSSIRATFQEESPGCYISLGASYRLDFHEDKFIEVDEFGNPVVEEETPGKKQLNSLQKAWTKIKGIFVKTEKVEIDSITPDGEVEKKIVKIKIDERDRKKSVLKDILKKSNKIQKQKKRETKKLNRKERRKALKEENKARKEARKGLQKKEKENLKRIEELEIVLNNLQQQRKELNDIEDSSNKNSTGEKLPETKEEKLVKKEIAKLKNEIETNRRKAYEDEGNYLEKTLSRKSQEEFDKKEHKILKKKKDQAKKIKEIEKKLRAIQLEKKQKLKSDPDYSMDKTDKEKSLEADKEEIQKVIDGLDEKLQKLGDKLENDKKEILEQIKIEKEKALKKEKEEKEKEIKKREAKEEKDRLEKDRLEKKEKENNQENINEGGGIKIIKKSKKESASEGIKIIGKDTEIKGQKESKKERRKRKRAERKERRRKKREEKERKKREKKEKQKREKEDKIKKVEEKVE